MLNLGKASPTTADIEGVIRVIRIIIIRMGIPISL